MAEPRRQSGIALITVLLILALGSAIVVSLSADRQADIRRTEHLARSARFWQQVHNLESWAVQALERDRAASEIDAENDIRAMTLAKTAIAGGFMQARIIDLQGRFNVNNLVTGAGEPNAAEIARFRLLLALLKINPALADAIVDWLDADADRLSRDGAEDEAYGRRQPPYRSANRPLADIAELSRVQGVDAAVLRRLAPYVYSADGYAPLNVNTAAPLLLRTLSEKLSERDAERLISTRRKAPFEKTEAFLKQDEVADLSILKAGIGVASEHFLLIGAVTIGGRQFGFSSRLFRNGGRAAVVGRGRLSPES